MKALHLDISRPCQENWHRMSSVAQGRFCQSCAKTVVDFSVMSDAEIFRYFNERREGEVCGRLHTGQLNVDIFPGLTHKSRISRYWNYLLAMFLFFIRSGPAKAQGNISKVDVSLFVSDSAKGLALKGHCNTITSKKVDLKGKVVDEKGDPVPYANILVKGTNMGVPADVYGNFILLKVHIPAIMLVEAAGFKKMEFPVVDTGNHEVRLMKEFILMRELFINSNLHIVVGGVYSRTCRIKKTKKKPVKPDIIPALPLKEIPGEMKVFPDPVHRGNDLNLQFSHFKTATYKLVIMDIMGHFIRQLELTIDPHENSAWGAIRCGEEWPVFDHD